MYRALIAAAATCLFAAVVTSSAQDAAPTSRPVDLSAIEGDYAVVSASRNGQAPPPPIAQGMRVSVRGDRITITAGGRPNDAIVTAVDATQKPAHIDMMSAAPGGAGTRNVGIYALEGDTLKLCYTKGDARPTAFAGGPDVTLFVLKRDAAGGATTRP